MRFSIIVPIYNAEQYLEEALSSILEQQYEDFEVILINDGSIDNSGAICDLCKVKHGEKIQVEHKSNQGQLLARCSGIAKAKGEYCLFLDADDLLTKNSLEVLDDIMNRHNNPDLILFSFYYFKKKEPLKRADFPLTGEEIFSGINKRQIYELLFESTAFNSMCMKAVRTELVKNMRADFEKYSSLRSGEDRLQSMAIIDCAKTIVATNEPLYIYRLLEGSVTRSFCMDTIERFNMKLLCKFEEALLCKWNMNDKVHMEKLQAFFLNHVIYIFLKYYSEVNSRKEKRALLNYDWSNFVEVEYLNRIGENIYVNEYYKKVWNCILKKRYTKLRLMLLKRTIYMNLRALKRAVCN